jgi:hypothetical protein
MVEHGREDAKWCPSGAKRIMSIATGLCNAGLRIAQEAIWA